ncbi:uncharacterized protein LOC111633839 [Centruroides sculpturatus]|uniref:uncharacterized protein LOC111633839 n=1 Tax=Centruroides sculpturatus TaxID=218467 RepID=UPI000C6CCA86|nr:uncharacterized protein LOC111633839 [Centruroides sculpturatus]
MASKGVAAITENQFQHLLHQISPRIQKQTIKFEEPISPAERLTVTLRFLATGITFRDLTWEFRIDQDTVYPLHVFVADDAFGLKPYILKPYGGNDLTLEEWICNYRYAFSG